MSVLWIFWLIVDAWSVIGELLSVLWIFLIDYRCMLCYRSTTVSTLAIKMCYCILEYSLHFPAFCLWFPWSTICSVFHFANIQCVSLSYYSVCFTWLIENVCLIYLAIANLLHLPISYIFYAQLLLFSVFHLAIIVSIQLFSWLTIILILINLTDGNMCGWCILGS